MDCCWEVGQDGESLGLVGGERNNDNDKTIVPLGDAATIFQRPALCSLLLIPTRPLGDAICNYIVLVIY